MSRYGSVPTAIEELEALRERLHGNEAVHMAEMRQLVDILHRLLSAAKDVDDHKQSLRYPRQPGSLATSLGD